MSIKNQAIELDPIGSLSHSRIGSSRSIRRRFGKGKIIRTSAVVICALALAWFVLDLWSQHVSDGLGWDDEYWSDQGPTEPQDEWYWVSPSARANAARMLATNSFLSLSLSEASILAPDLSPSLQGKAYLLRAVRDASVLTIAGLTLCRSNVLYADGVLWFQFFFPGYQVLPRSRKWPIIVILPANAKIEHVHVSHLCVGK